MGKFEIKEKILSMPAAYSFFQKLVIGNIEERFYLKYIDKKRNMKVLDIGCGPANILNYLPDDVEYYGFDMSEKYIKNATEKYSNRNVKFFQRIVDEFSIEELGQNEFDYIFAFGVFHHIDDNDVIKIFTLSKQLLKNGGKLLTIDPCFVDSQNMIAKLVALNDRGKFVRHFRGYEKIANTQTNGEANCTMHSDLLKFPYNHCVVEYIK